MAQTPAKSESRVVALLNDHGEPTDGAAYRVVINSGSNAGVKVGDRFIIYTMGPELNDPVNGKSLGALEIVRGVGSVAHVQPTISIVRTSETKEEDRVNLGMVATLGRPYDRVTVPVPFRLPKIGDFARPV